MKKETDRRGFFRSLVRPFDEARMQVPSRINPPPPYSLNSENALQKCESCDKFCVSECPEKIIYIGKNGRPQLNFPEQGCTFCEKCAEACTFDVLNIENPAIINAEIVLNRETCLSWKGILCRSCADACEKNVIVFNGMKDPGIINHECTRCGMCVRPCPTNAIEIYTY